MGRPHKKSKIVIALALLGIAMTHAAVTTDKLTIVDCSDGTWQMALVSGRQTGDTLDIVADLAYSGNFTGQLHRITLRLTGCSFRRRCRSISYANVEDVDCDAKILSHMDRYACIVTESLATCPPLPEELSSQYISGLYGKICFTHQDVHINWDSSSSEADCSSSGSSNDSSGSSGENSSSPESKGSHEKSSSSSKESKGSGEKPGHPSNESKGSGEKADHPSKESKEAKDSKENSKDSSKEENGASSSENNGSPKPPTGSSKESSSR